VLLAAAVVLAASCELRPPERSARDDFRSSCAAAAKWHRLAAGEAASRQMAPDDFAALDEAYDGVHALCREVLGGGQPLDAAAAAEVEVFNAHYGEPYP
jgi:hypothetical protein